MNTDVLIVTHNSARHLKNCIASIPLENNIYIWDNKSSDTSYLEEIRRDKTKIFYSDKNIGFGAAHNNLARKAGSKFIFIINPDTEIQHNTIENLERYANLSNNNIAVNPSIYEKDGRGFVKSKSHLLHKSIDISPKWSAQHNASLLPILSGSALFVLRKTFLQINGFDENIFMYFEDDDLSIRLSQSGTICLRMDDLHIIHHAGQGSGRSLETAKIKNFHWARSRVYACHKHGVKWAFFKGLAESIRYQFKGFRHGAPNMIMARPYLIIGSFAALFMKRK
jgi:GT2 family glycosyltransferase